MITKIGELIERVKSSVMQRGIEPTSALVVRLGDTGTEMQIEHVKVRHGVAGSIMILQVKVPQ